MKREIGKEKNRVRRVEKKGLWIILWLVKEKELRGKFYILNEKMY